MMRQLMLPKKSQRQLGLIKFFFANRGKVFNYEDLAREMDSSVSVVFPDMQDIEQNFPNEIELIKKGKSGVSLDIAPHLAYNYFLEPMPNDRSNFNYWMGSFTTVLNG